MRPEQLARLFQQRSQTRLIRFDEQAVMSASPHALKKELWEKFKTPLSARDDDEFLQKLKLLTSGDDGELWPSVSGILMASQRPCEHIPNAYVQCVAYRGQDRGAAY